MGKDNLCTLYVLCIISSALVMIGVIGPYYIDASAQKSNQNQTMALALHTLVQNGSPFIGNLSAPITVIDFSDFQCYLCNRFVKNTEPQINETYIQTGKAALVFKHLPNRGFDSMNAALAAQCTNDQGKFWQYHKLLYSNQKPIDSGWVSIENLKKFASEIPELDILEFNSCLDDEKYKTSIQNDIDLALSFGFKETPSFIIVNSDGSNPEFLQGALPFPSFKEVIDKMLSKFEKRVQ
jgi:protein-disulfide isomerase